ncbi:hypothetical protein [Paenibacillus lutimineralis]|uniref:Cellobiose phosphorylase n=1 Tax=Paenibacillus lutimineralis TaxID=2707005 RepID=A0A3Q9IHX4_9BACL|nr:hypothetical protein [Paenibacillus lutimineralis]AZS18410.1 hypothetical protein EI981_22160 [Paenibacillus lutimineralis]
MEAYYNCMRCKNKRVRILTADRRHFVGTIVDVDCNNVYLRVDRDCEVRTSAFFPGTSGSDIITLSLFVLLAIALI